MAKRNKFPDTLFVSREVDGKDSYLVVRDSPEEAVDEVQEGKTVVALYKRVKLVSVERGLVVVQDVL